MKELVTPGGEHHGIGDGEWLVMTKNEDPLSGAPNGHQICSAENSVSPGLVLLKSCKLESKTRGKVLGKVDTLERHQHGTIKNYRYI